MQSPNIEKQCLIEMPLKKNSHYSHLGFLEFLLAVEDESKAPSLATPELVAPSVFISTHTHTERKREGNDGLGINGKFSQCDDFLKKDQIKKEI
jgi:hypothetical protein